MDQQESVDNVQESRENAQDRRRQITPSAEQDYTDKPSSLERRRSVVDRRLALNRHRGPGKRRSEQRRAAEEGQMSDEQFEFLMAVDEYKKANMRPFPTWTEVLELIKALGYRKVAEPRPLAPLENEQPQPAEVAD